MRTWLITEAIRRLDLKKIFIFYISVSLSAAEATWDIERIKAKQGDAVTITCTADNIGLFDVVRIEKRVSTVRFKRTSAFEQGQVQDFP